MVLPHISVLRSLGSHGAAGCLLRGELSEDDPVGSYPLVEQCSLRACVLAVIPVTRSQASGHVLREDRSE